MTSTQYKELGRYKETVMPPSLVVVLPSSLAAVPPLSATLESIKILKKCKEAIPSRGEGGKVIIIEMVLEKELEQMKKSSVETQLCCDVLMMTTFNGSERNEKEWNTLFLAVGFGHYTIIPILGLRSLIVVYPN
ncbi:trans-resveratrol di-O-methyltransferase-like [Cucumis melo var. makuwa]|uniref:Trans-resveratrol di-O-methyltransferase-like n=1 Tax=Cucumis melo var. makuwa TaxID=1194695 RepID=A0A5A7UZJ4_CUCMM|nr:trans-resveratrol di-O-methyltransferase-like [Cucumis melo var. makuwa]